AAFAAAGLAACNLCFAYFKLPESRQPGVFHPAHALSLRAGIAAAFRRPAVARILASTFLATFAFVGLEATFALFSQKQFGLGAAGFGLVFTYLGLVIVVVQGGFVGRLSKRYGERPMAATGAALMALAFVALAVSPNVGV